MPTITTNYSFSRPTIGGDDDDWGNLLNANWTALDTLLFSGTIGADTSGNAATATTLTTTLGVAGGGTGRTTLASGGLLLGAGAGAVNVLTGSAVGQVPQWNGTTWTASAPSGVTNVTASAPLSSSGGATPNITFSGALAVANGGTGATSQSAARTNLGLGTIATQDSNAVSITGGSIGSGVSITLDPAAVLAATAAGAGAGAVGSYAFLWHAANAGARGPGTLEAGSNLRYANDGGNGIEAGNSTTAAAGTWRLMGVTGFRNASGGGFGGPHQTSLWLRIA